MDARSAAFDAARPVLFSIAYRMLGSVMDAEDVVQDAWLRWQQTPESEVRSPQAYLTTIVTRLSINHLRSARVQREVYPGTWLPEPLLTTNSGDPMASVELAESLSMAFLVLLERLSPVERAVFLLHEVFDFEYAAIARIVGKSEANCRQLVTRARKHLGARPRFEADAGHAAQLVERFTQAAGGGAVEDLVSLLAEDITLWADGGGQAPGAALKPVHGAEAVSRFVNGVIRKFVPPERVLLPGSVNGQPGFIVYAGGRPMAAMVFDIRAGRIHTIYAIGNPDKLRSIPPLSA